MRLCFFGMTGTFTFKFDAYSVDEEDVACSSVILNVAWVGQITYLSFDGTDPRAGDECEPSRLIVACLLAVLAKILLTLACSGMLW